MKAQMWVWMMIAIGAAHGATKPTKVESLEVTEGVEWVEVPKAYRGGAMTVLDDGQILMAFTRHGNVKFPPGSCKLYTITSRDAGKTWQDERLMVRADGVALIQETTPYNAGRPTLLRTRDGRIGVFYFGFVKAEEKCDLWVTWSADKGGTWTEPQRIFDKAYHPGPRGAVELDSGRIVVVFHYTSTEKGRWSPSERRGRNVCASLVSDDGGKTWNLSPSVDVGKGAQHAGAMEPTVVKQRNGHLWMVIRTHHGAYWQSFSKDQGLSWSEPVATNIEIPKRLGGAPCALTRLASGRLAMVWNPRMQGPLDQGSKYFKLCGRGQLAVALSEDDGRTWTKPFVFARSAMLSYPCIVEPSPGRLVISTGLIVARLEGQDKKMTTDTVVFRLNESAVLAKKGKAEELKPLSNVKYGKHPRQVLDFYPARSDKPTPVAFYIHGGAWKHGDKKINPRPFLDKGISVVAINYRFVQNAKDDNTHPPVKAPLSDAVRALQFVRMKAGDWNLNKDRIGAIGRSAGGCSSLWLAFHDDMVNSDSADPLARESTRLYCAAVDGAQVSLDPKQLRQWMPNFTYGAHAFGLPNFQSFYDKREELITWIKAYSPIEHVSKDDPPIGLYYDRCDVPVVGTSQRNPTHSAIMGVTLGERLEEVGVDVVLVHPGKSHPEYTTSTQFLIGHLLK